MMNRFLQNEWCRFFAGNLSVGLLVIGIPVVILLSVTQTLAASTAGLLILAFVHMSLVGLQISWHGTWIPEKWLAAAFVPLPVIDVFQTVSMFSKGLWVEGVWAFLMALGAAFFTVHIARTQRDKWRTPKSPSKPLQRPIRKNRAENHPADDPTMMVY